MQLFFAGGEEQELGMAAAGRSTLSRLHWLGGGGGVATGDGASEREWSTLSCTAFDILANVHDNQKM